MQPHEVCLAIWKQGKLRRAYLTQHTMITNRVRGLIRSGFEDPTSDEAKEFANETLAKLVAGKCEDELWVTSFEGFMVSLRAIEDAIQSIEKQLKVYARQLPIWKWAKQSPGIAEITLANLIAEIVNPGDYSGPAKVWKRMGVAVINGDRQRKIQGEAAIEQGYCAARRSVLWSAANGIIRVTHDPRYKEKWENHPWVQCYTNEKAKQLEAGLPNGHADNRARRKMSKLMLRDLWREWRATT